MILTRRHFLQFAAPAVVGAGILAEELLKPSRTIFLPPANGWYQGVRIREVEAYDIATDNMILRHDAAWRLPSGEIKQFYVMEVNVRPEHRKSSRDPARAVLARLAAEHGLIDMPQHVLPLPTWTHALYT